MPDRPAPGPRAGRPPVAELLLVCCAMVDGQLAVLVRAGASAGKAVLPTAPLVAGDDPDRAAGGAARTLLGRSPAWMAQGSTTARAAAPALAVSYVMLVAAGTAAPSGCLWQTLGGTAPIARSAKRVVDEAVAKAADEAVALLRRRMDFEPIAFRMLPPTFTLSELQRLYELLLGGRLHKVSFRRTLLASGLVRPTDTWRSEGRGRPAQLFRYAPRRPGKGRQRSVRFDLLR